LRRKRLGLDRLLKCAETDLRELRVLLKQCSVDLIGRVEHDLSTQVLAYLPVVRQHLRLFQAQHPNETGRAFGALLEAFLTKEVEATFRNWKLWEDDEIQTQLDGISSRFVAQANGILERLQEAAGALFETSIEHLSVTCSLRVDSHLHYRVDRVFYSLERFLLLLPRFLLRPIVLRRMNERLWSVLDMNAGRIRYDYLERLQSSMAQFENDLSAAVIMVTDSLKSVLSEAEVGTHHQTTTLDLMDSVIRDCTQLLT
jgi:hypothetical protein